MRARAPVGACRQTEHAAVTGLQTSTTSCSKTANLGLLGGTDQPPPSRVPRAVIADGVQEPPARPRRSPDDPAVQAALARVSAVLWRGFLAVHGDDATHHTGMRSGA